VVLSPGRRREEGGERREEKGGGRREEGGEGREERGGRREERGGRREEGGQGTWNARPVYISKSGAGDFEVNSSRRIL